MINPEFTAEDDIPARRAAPQRSRPAEWLRAVRAVLVAPGARARRAAVEHPERSDG